MHFSNRRSKSSRSGAVPQLPSAELAWKALHGGEAMTFFDVFGPFDVAHNERIIPRAQPDLWSEVHDYAPGLPNAIGCYLYGLRYGERITPWYVGMTVSQGGFAGETFQQHKIDNYSYAMSLKRGAPVIFLFPLMKNDTDFSSARKAGKPAIRWLEKTLMNLAYNRNPKISNIKDMRMVREVEVRGLLGPLRKGRPYHEVKAIRRVLLGAR